MDSAYYCWRQDTIVLFDFVRRAPRCYLTSAWQNSTISVLLVRYEAEKDVAIREVTGQLNLQL